MSDLPMYHDLNSMILDGVVTELRGGGVFIMQSTTPMSDGPEKFIALTTPVRSNPDDPIHEKIGIGSRVRITGTLTKTGVIAHTIAFRSINREYHP